MAIQGNSETSLRQENAGLNQRLTESEAALRAARQQLAGFEHDRRRLEEDQRLTNERLTLVARATDDALYDWDLRTVQVWSNDAYRRQFGNHALDVNVDMQEWALGIHPDDRERVQTDLFAAINGTVDNWSAEYHFQRAGGGYAYVLDRMHIVRDGEGRAVRMTGAMFDLTERRRAEDALRASQEKFAKAFHLSPMMLTITSLADGRLLDVNQSLLDTTGYTRDEVLGHTPVEMGWWVHPEEREKNLPMLQAQGRLQNQEAAFRMHNGEKRTCLYSVEIIEINGQPCVLTALVDITERKQAEAALQALNATLEARVIERTAELRDSQAQLRKLSAYAERMREDERTRIAREVHDELGGSLTALKMTLARIHKGRENDADLLTRMGDIRNQIDELVQTVRRVASDLRPPLLDDFGLVAALKWQAEEWQRRTGIACELDLPTEEVQLDRARRTAVFRVFQESLTNVARHAHATQVMTIMREDADQLVLTVRDNGRGIDEDALRPGKSLGLLGIRERMRDVAGDVDISGTPGLGTTVIVRVPLDGQDGIH